MRVGSFGLNKSVHTDDEMKESDIHDVDCIVTWMGVNISIHSNVGFCCCSWVAMWHLVSSITAVGLDFPCWNYIYQHKNVHTNGLSTLCTIQQLTYIFKTLIKNQVMCSFLAKLHSFDTFSLFESVALNKMLQRFRVPSEVVLSLVLGIIVVRRETNWKSSSIQHYVQPHPPSLEWWHQQNEYHRNLEKLEPSCRNKITSN